MKDITGPNYRGGVAIIGVTRDGKPEATLHAEKRFYNSTSSMMTEAAIDGGFTRDLYAALGEAGQRRMGRASVLQTVYSLDLGRRVTDGAGRIVLPV